MCIYSDADTATALLLLLLLVTRVPAHSNSLPAIPPSRRRPDLAEENVKERLILEMRAEITRLRANVMTAHEKIRTLEQLHAHDELRLQQLLDELAVQQGPEAVKRFKASSAAAAAPSFAWGALTAVKEEDDAEVSLKDTSTAVEKEPGAPGTADTDENTKHKLDDASEDDPTPKKPRRVVESFGAVEV